MKAVLAWASEASWRVKGWAGEILCAQGEIKQAALTFRLCTCQEEERNEQALKEHHIQWSPSPAATGPTNRGCEIAYNGENPS